jgi:hypothetical protein
VTASQEEKVEVSGRVAGRVAPYVELSSDKALSESLESQEAREKAEEE